MRRISNLLSVIVMANVVVAVLSFDCWPLIGTAQKLQKPTGIRASVDDEQIEKFQVASSRGTGAIGKKDIRNNYSTNGWDSFKDLFYNTADGVGSLSEKLASGSGGSGVEGGYSSIEKTVLSQQSNLSPGQRLMKEYKSRSETGPIPTQQATTGSQGSAFDAIKLAAYEGFDAAASVFNNEETENQESLRSFKPLVQSTISRSSAVQGALPALNSENPITRKIAESKIRSLEEKEKKRQRNLQREEAARNFKESVYRFGDAVVASAETLAAVPEQAAKLAEETQELSRSVQKSVEQIPGRVDEVVTTVASIPDQVKAKSDQVQDSVKSTVESTTQVISEISSIPSKVGSSVKETQRKVNDVREAVDEAATRVKVFVGVEKPVPKPPKKPPPKPPTASEITMKIAGSVVTGVATGTAKVVWWAGKGVASTAWNGVQSAYSDATKKGEFEDPKSGAKSDEEVDKEVQEALDLAQTALEFADGDKQKRKDENKNNQ